MRPPQTTTSVDRLFSWTNRPATVCWSCALQQRRPLSRSSPGADEAQDATPRHTIRGYEAWSERGRRSGPLGGSQPTRVKRPLIRDNLANGPDQGGSDVHFGPQTPRLRAPPTPPKLNVYGFSKRQVKRSLERGSLLPGMLKFGSKPNSPKHFPVSFTSDDDLSESRLPQSKLRTIKHGTRTVSVQDESEQRLDAALDHWNSNLALSISEPSDTLAGLDTVDPNSQSIWGHRPGKVPLSGLLFAKNKRANTGQSLSDFKTSSTSSIGFVRAAHTSSMVCEHNLTSSLHKRS